MRISLRQRLVVLLLPALVAAVLLGAVWTYFVGQRAAALAYDQALMATAADVALGLRFVDGQPRFELSQQTERMLRSDARDQLFFAVRLMDGAFVAGDPDLGSAPLVRLGEGSSVDLKFRNGRVRALAMQFEQDRIPFTVTVAETTHKRQDMAWSVLVFIAVPAAVVLCIAGLIVWVVVRSGLRPLDALERELAARSELDLSPIDASHAPREVHSLVEALNHLLSRLDKAARAQQSFVADAAHQLRTPLAGVQGQIELLATLEADQQDDAMKRLRSSVGRTVRLANQLLSLARSEHDPSTLNLRDLDLSTLVRESADDWVHRSIVAGIDFGFELAPSALRGDPFLIGELIENLVGNALNYSGRGSSITVSTAARQNTVELCVDDSGPGIPPAERERVFERFHRLPGNSNDGSGLGLAIVQQIAMRHRGSVEISQSMLGGARVCVRLPRRPAPGA